MKAKRLLSASFALAMLSVGLGVPFGNSVGIKTAVTASAYTSRDFEYNVLDDGTVEITGYNGSEADLIIPAKIDDKAVTVIGDYAFTTGPYMGNEKIVDVTIPDSVTSIGEFAFAFCGNLKSINIPDSVTIIGVAAFNDCSKLERVIFSNGVTIIGERAFYGCSSLKGINIPNSVKTIGGWAFCNCTGFSSVVIPKNVESISENAFGYIDGFDKRDDFTIYGYKNTVAEEYANSCGFTFVDLDKEYTCGDWKYTLLANGTAEIIKYSGNDTIVNVPAVVDGKNVTSLRDVFAPWNYKGNITEIHLPSGVKNIGAQAFSNCESLEIVDIPNSVESIGDSAFWCCTKLKTIKLPDSVKKLGAGAFSGCTSLEEITLSNNITSLNTFGFDAVYYGVLSDCPKLKSVVIPKAVTTIDDYAVGYIEVFLDGDNSKIEKVDGFTIYGHKGTAAETYANKNGFIFIDLDEPTPEPVDPTPDPEKKSLIKATVKAADKTYTGKALKPAVTVKLDDKTLKKGVDYTVVYKNNKNCGKGKVTVKGIGNYEGTKSGSFIIKPAKVTAKKLTSPKTKTVKLTWTSAKGGVTGYKVQVALDKKFKSGKKIAWVKKGSSTAKTVTGLKKGKVYFVRVCAYKTVDGKKVFGAWSAVKKVKCK